MAGRPNTDGSGQIQRAPNGNGGDEKLESLLVKMGPQIQLALPKHLNADRMARVALTALRTTPKLAECEKWSFAACVLQAAQLGLEVNTPLGHAYLIPRANNRKGGIMECTLQIGYQGMIDLARRSGQVASIFAYTVHEGDAFEYALGLDPTLKHVPNVEAVQSEKTMRFVYAVAKLRGDGDDRQFVVLTKRQVEERKARGAGGPAWKTDYLAMAKKTAVRALFTWLPKSPEMARVSVVDDVETGAVSMPRALDSGVLDALSGLQLPPPQDEAPAPIETTGETIDPRTGEVNPDSEPTDAEIEAERAQRGGKP